MNLVAHKARHVELHAHLDELIADFIQHTDKRPSNTTLMEFLQWSSRQCENPDVDEKTASADSKRA